MFYDDDRVVDDPDDAADPESLLGSRTIYFSNSTASSGFSLSTAWKEDKAALNPPNFGCNNFCKAYILSCVLAVSGRIWFWEFWYY